MYVQDLVQAAIGLTAIVAAIIAGWILFWYFRARTRRAAVRRAARQCGEQFVDRTDQDLIDGLSIFRLFSRHPTQRISNMVVRQSEELYLAVFDYEWREYGCDGGSTWERRTVVHVKSARLQLPQFYLCPNGLIQKLTSVFRSKTTFDGHPEFMRRYDLRMKDEQAVRRWFHAGLLRLLERDTRTFIIEGCGSQLVLCLGERGFFGDGRARPEDFPPLLQFGAALCEQFLARTNETPADPAGLVDMEFIDEPG